MLLYVGPDQLIPFSGLVGTIIGLALIFWGKLMQVFRKLFGMLSSKRPAEGEPRS